MDESFGQVAFEALPDLDTDVGMIGASHHVEVGGEVCFETGVVIILSAA